MLQELRSETIDVNESGTQAHCMYTAFLSCGCHHVAQQRRYGLFRSCHPSVPSSDLSEVLVLTTTVYEL